MGLAGLASADQVNAREVGLWAGILMLFLTVSMAAVGARGLPLLACAAFGGCLAMFCGMDAIRARRLAARHRLAVLAVGEAIASGSAVIDAFEVAAALDDEWLTNLAKNVREEQRLTWEGRVERGECSDR